MKDRIVLLAVVFFYVFTSLGFAQATTSDSPKEEFEKGGFDQAPTTPVGGSGTIKPGNTQTSTRRTKGTVGRFGMKIWFQRQIACDATKPFLTVAPTTAFMTGDCVRVKFRLNFPGYLTIVNVGTSGKRNNIFPDQNQSNLLSPKTDYVFPQTGSWKFQGNPGDEQLLFVVSKSRSKSAVIDTSEKEPLITKESPDFEVLDRDIVPVTENDEVFVLADESRFENALVFRIKLKHRRRN